MDCDYTSSRRWLFGYAGGGLRFKLFDVTDLCHIPSQVCFAAKMMRLRYVSFIILL